MPLHAAGAARLLHNVSANLAAQVYVTLLGVLVMPLYLARMGSEAYGLIGFFVMVQSWFNLLDLGISPTVAREAARWRAGAVSGTEFRALLRTLTLLFALTAALGCAAFTLGAGPLASRWLKVEALPLGTVTLCLRCMGVAVALRWVSGLFRACVTGCERLVWLSGFNGLIATLRFPGALPVLQWAHGDVVAFFAYQVGVAALELGGLAHRAAALAPRSESPTAPGHSWQADLRTIGPVLHFSLAIALTSTLWTLVTQTDKLLLSRLLSLAEYGYFSLAVMVAGGITLLGAPLGSALLPRLARLHAEDAHDALAGLYRDATQAAVLMSVPAAAMLAVFAPEVLQAWTGNATAVRSAAPLLSLYAWGNGILAVSAFPYYLQYARGNLRLHLAGSLLFTALLIPGLWIAVLRQGALGAGEAWLTVNLAYFLAWVPWLHRRLAPGLHMRWLMQDVLAPALPCLAVVFLANRLLTLSEYRVALAAELVVIGLAATLAAVLGSSMARRKLAGWRS